MNVVVMGQGYVGLPLALRIAELGIKVTGYDTNPELGSRLNARSELPCPSITRRPRIRAPRRPKWPSFSKTRFGI